MLSFTWGRIVDILMENKCMNLSYFIDELDKVSKTTKNDDILTHLIDSTQKRNFRINILKSEYIDLDMSKTLFIFSYCDISVIDKFC